MINLDAMKTVLQEETETLRFHLRESRKQIEELEKQKKALSEKVRTLENEKRQECLFRISQ